MEQKLDKKIEFTDRLFLFLKENKFKLLLLTGLLLIIFIGSILFKNFQEKKKYFNFRKIYSSRNIFSL